MRKDSEGHYSAAKNMKRLKKLFLLPDLSNTTSAKVRNIARSSVLLLSPIQSAYSHLTTFVYLLTGIAFLYG